MGCEMGKEGRDQKLRETHRKSLTGVCDKMRKCRGKGKQVRTKVLIIDQKATSHQVQGYDYRSHS